MTTYFRRFLIPRLIHGPKQPFLRVGLFAYAVPLIRGNIGIPWFWRTVRSEKNPRVILSRKGLSSLFLRPSLDRQTPRGILTVHTPPK